MVPIRPDHDAVSNQANFAAPEDSRRDQMKNVLHAAMDHGVAGIVATLTADNNVGLGSEHVDDLALALIPPLHPN